jgi:hypothetical protein
VKNSFSIKISTFKTGLLNVRNNQMNPGGKPHSCLEMAYMVRPHKEENPAGSQEPGTEGPNCLLGGGMERIGQIMTHLKITINKYTDGWSLRFGGVREGQQMPSNLGQQTYSLKLRPLYAPRRPHSHT